MELAFFPSLLGSNLQMFTLFPLPIRPGIHYPDFNKAGQDWLWPSQVLLRTQTKNSAYPNSGLWSLIAGITCPPPVISRRETVLYWLQGTQCPEPLS